MDRFSFSWTPARQENMIRRGKCRITVLTSRMIRLETGELTDLPTQTVWYRDLGKVEYTLKKQGCMLIVNTSEVAFMVDVHQGKLINVTFPDGKIVTDFEKGNLLGTARTLDMVNGSTKLEKGIMSASGVSQMDDSKSLLLDGGKIIARKPCVDRYYFAYGHDHRRCLRDFFRLTGQVPLIPKFALGNWWSRYKAYTQEEYQNLMQNFIDRDIPITVATIDMDWHWTDVLERFGKEAAPPLDPCGNKEAIFYNRFMPGWTGYSWNNELFPDHKALLNWLHKNNFHVTLNVHPSQGIRYYEACYADACEKMGIDPDSKKAVCFDAADNTFWEAYFDAAHHPLEAEGVDFWWLDWQQGKKTSIPGLDPLWALNHYHTLDSGREDKRPMILSRYAGLGSHRYPLGFSGDTFCTWKSLAFQPYFTNNASNAGYTWWSHDIGGHQQGDQDDELYLRWLQYGIFSPINRLHSSNSDFMGKEPWKRSYSVKKIAEDFLRLRHKLIPYLYTANYETHTAGIPICQPMYYLYDCKDAYEAKNQYIFGSKLLVCPVTQPADKRLNLARTRVWLPEGRWTDFFTGKIYRGGQWVDMYRDLDSIPVLAGEGTIVPMYRNGNTNDLSLAQPMDIHIWRGCGNYTLYEDDGCSNAYLQGASVYTLLEVREDNGSLLFSVHRGEGDLSLLPERREIALHFRDLTDGSIWINGRAIEAACNGYVVVNLEIDPRIETVVEVRDAIPSSNTPKRELAIDLLTRVQGSNLWKNTVFPSRNNGYSYKKLPGYIREALSELEKLWYA